MKPPKWTVLTIGTAIKDVLTLVAALIIVAALVRGGPFQQHPAIGGGTQSPANALLTDGGRGPCPPTSPSPTVNPSPTPTCPVVSPPNHGSIEARYNCLAKKVTITAHDADGWFRTTGHGTLVFRQGGNTLLTPWTFDRGNSSPDQAIATVDAGSSTGVWSVHLQEDPSVGTTFELSPALCPCPSASPFPTVPPPSLPPSPTIPPPATPRPSG